MEGEGIYWSNSSLIYTFQRKNAISMEQQRERGETYLDAILASVGKTGMLSWKGAGERNRIDGQW